MSQVEELLNSVAEVPAHTHPVPDTDTYFIIDPITRRIENTTRKKNVIMQYDHNSERFTFELPRYIDGHDMLECTSVTVNVDNIETVETDGIEVTEPRVNSDAPDMTDLRQHPDNPDKVISSWLISRNSTQLAGILSFHIEYKCVDSNGNVVYEWGTDTYDEIEIKARKKNGETVVTEYADLLEQWRAQIFGAGDSVMADIEAEGKTQVAAVKAESESQQEAVELKGAQTLETIPEDYTEVDIMADEAVRSKGDAIVCEAAGEPIVLKDSSNDHIRGLKLFGKSTQDGIPTPDNPVEIASVANPTINICSKNMVDSAAVVRTVHANVTARGNEIRVQKTNTGNVYSNFYYRIGSWDEFAGRTITVSIENLSEYIWHIHVGGLDDSNAWIANDLLRSRSLEGKVKTVFTVTIPKNTTARFLGLRFVSDDTIVSSETYNFRNLQVEVGNTATDYEPYKLPQSLTVNCTLPGIPVTSGGNYTDSDGQQWICDEVDLEHGVRMQRINTLVLTGGESIANVSGDYAIPIGKAAPNNPDSKQCLCNYYPAKGRTELGQMVKFENQIGVSANLGYIRFADTLQFPDTNMPAFADFLAEKHAAGNPVTVAYVLAKPVEKPLTAEEITAFKALRTNYPNTTILNDAGAWMGVKYNADTKTYVDNPKILKLVDSSTGVVYELKIVDGNLTVVPV